jgi:predicted amidohydrolase YtcJ
VLDVFEDILTSKPLTGLLGFGPNTNVTEMRPRIEHAQIMQPSDLERIGRLGVIASVQPTHA